jgi:hypothetical protein
VTMIPEETRPAGDEPFAGERDSSPRRSGSGVRVETEVETDRGWSFSVIVPCGADAPETRHEVRLSFVDYEFWSHGTVGPSRVVEAVVAALDEADGPGVPRPLPASFDASTARRWVRDVDELVRARL